MTRWGYLMTYKKRQSVYTVFKNRGQFIHTVLLRLVRQVFHEASWLVLHVLCATQLIWLWIEMWAPPVPCGQHFNGNKPNLSGGGRQSRIAEFLFKRRLKLFIVCSYCLHYWFLDRWTDYAHNCTHARTLTLSHTLSISLSTLSKA